MVVYHRFSEHEVRKSWLRSRTCSLLARASAATELCGPPVFDRRVGLVEDNRHGSVEHGVLHFLGMCSVMDGVVVGFWPNWEHHRVRRAVLQAVVDMASMLWTPCTHWREEVYMGV